MIKFSINLAQVNKDLIKTVTLKDGSTAKFLNLVAWPYKDGPKEWSDGTIKHDLSKAEREEGVEADQILGNYQDKGNGQAGGKASPAPITPHNASKANGYAPKDNDDLSDLPF